MRWLAALLLIANVTLYLYFSTSERDRQLLSASKLSAVNEQSMLLQKELLVIDAQTRLCYRVGPLVKQGQIDFLVGLFDELTLNYNKRSSDARNVFFYDLLVQDELQRKRAKQLLGQASLGDHFEAQIVGVYFSRALAQKKMQEMQEQGVAATLRKRRKRLGGEMRFWFDFEVEGSLEKKKLMNGLRNLYLQPREVACDFVS